MTTPTAAGGPLPPRTAIIAITKHGAARARELAAKFPAADLILSEKFRHLGGPDVHAYSGPLKAQIGAWFNRYDALIFHVSLGAVVRLIAPHLAGKEVDPAVLVIDDAGRFVIPLLSGHVGGANQLAEAVAEGIGATPVVTTASDVGRTIPVDILGRELGWQVDGGTRANLTRVAAAVVNEEPIAFVQETGEPDWWRRPTPLPAAITRYDTLDTVTLEAVSAVLWVTDRNVTEDPRWEYLENRVVVYRPRSLVLGLGCDRGTSRETLADAIIMVLDRHGLSVDAVRNVATIDAKRDEPGLCALAAEMGWKVETFPASQLAAVKGVPNPSAVVMKYMGTPAVGEPAAMLSAQVGTGGLIVPKVKFKGSDGLNATVSVARIDFSAPPA